jgi:hypothetical protein
MSRRTGSLRDMSMPSRADLEYHRDQIGQMLDAHRDRQRELTHRLHRSQLIVSALIGGLTAEIVILVATR